MTTDDTWHGAASPPAGSEHDYTGPQPPDDPYDPRNPLPTPRCTWPGTAASSPHGDPSAYRVSKNDEAHYVCRLHAHDAVQEGWTVHGLAADAGVVMRPGEIQDHGYSLPRRDPIDDLGAAGPPAPLVRWHCTQCIYQFMADDDADTPLACVRCRGDAVRCSCADDRTGPVSVEERAWAGHEDALRRMAVLAELGPADAELRDAAVEVKLGPVRARLDDIWAEIASTIVTVAGAGRRAVTQWRSAPDVQAPVSVHMAMQELAVSLGMAEGEIADGPLAELLRETAGMMRAEAVGLDKAAEVYPDGNRSYRLEGAARRLREQADVIDTTVGRDD